MNGELFSNHGKSPLANIPAVGDEIIYKTFRSNPSRKVEPKDFRLIVDKISYEIQEDWNGSYLRIANIHVSEVK